MLLGPDCSLLLVHGGADAVLPVQCSERIYRWAHEPKRKVILEGAGHGLDEAAEVVYETVRDWLLAELGRGGDQAGTGVAS
jgi:alpha-beta hydrolase superfamily lysophospholipase